MLPSELPPAFRGGPFVSCRENWYSGASLNVRSSQESLEKSQNETSPHQLVTQHIWFRVGVSSGSGCDGLLTLWSLFS